MGSSSSKTQVVLAPEDIATYCETGKLFGALIQQIFRDLNKFKSGMDIAIHFTVAVREKVHASAWFPFAAQENQYKEPFGSSVCISVNNCVAHGRPSSDPFHSGDLISVDMGFAIPSLRFPNRFLHFDAAFTKKYKPKRKASTTLAYAPLEALQEIQRQESLFLKDITRFIADVGVKHDYSRVDTLCGHGIGYSLHEPPFIQNGIEISDLKLIPNTVVCPEPMYIRGEEGTYLDSDGWAVMTRGLSSHWETMFLVQENGLVDLLGITSQKFTGEET